MTQHARAPATRSPSPKVGMDRTLRALTTVITDLVRMSAEDRPVSARHLDLLRARRQQLSAVLDALAHAHRRQADARAASRAAHTRQPPTRKSV